MSRAASSRPAHFGISFSLLAMKRGDAMMLCIGKSKRVERVPRLMIKLFLQAQSDVMDEKFSPYLKLGH